MGNDRLTICQISDIHCGNAYFIPELLDRTIIEINRANPTVVVVAGDLTDALPGGVRTSRGVHRSHRVRERHGHSRQPRLAQRRLHPLRAALRGAQSLMGLDDVVLVGVDSSEPDLNDGQVGREHYGFIEEAFSNARDKLTVFVVHHHLIPLPGTGRERNIIFDAGDVLERLVEARVDLVLSGHKHVPYSWRLEDMLIVNAGTASTLRLRGNTRPCYNVIEAEEGRWRFIASTRSRTASSRCASTERPGSTPAPRRRSALNIAVTRSIEPRFQWTLANGDAEDLSLGRPRRRLEANLFADR